MADYIQSNIESTSSGRGDVRLSRESSCTSPLGRSYSSILEYKSNKLKQVCQEVPISDPVRAVLRKCNNWMCPKCRKRRGFEFQRRLLEKLNLFKEPRLYTITINREWHESPKEAYRHVMRESLIPRLFRLLGIKRWVWVLEVQEETGDGWPHWHILIDVFDLKGMYYNPELKIAIPENPPSGDDWIYIPHFFDLNRVHELLRKWQIGEQCRLSVKKQDFKSPEHAIFYISKYLIKMPKKSFPEWMLNSPRLRFMGASRSIGQLVTDKIFTHKKNKSIKRKGDLSIKEMLKKIIREKKKKPTKMPYERIVECEQYMSFMQYSSWYDKYVEVGSCNAPKAALLLTPWAIKFKDFDFKNGEEFEVHGFKNRSQTWKFIDLWKEKGIQAIVKEKMDRDKNKIISEWNYKNN